MVSATRDVLFERLEAVFASEAFAELWPDVMVPKVYLGFPVNEPPCYVAVDEVAESIATEGAVTMGHVGITFDLRVWVFAQNTSLQVASDTMLALSEAIIMSVCVDQRLKGTVDVSFPELDAAGTAADSSKRYNAAGTVRVRCSVFSQCPAGLRSVVESV